MCVCLRAGVRLEGYLVAGYLLSARRAAPEQRTLTIIFLAIQIRSFDFSRAADLRDGGGGGDCGRLEVFTTILHADTWRGTLAVGANAITGLEP